MKKKEKKQMKNHQNGNFDFNALNKEFQRGMSFERKGNTMNKLIAGVTIFAFVIILGSMFLGVCTRASGGYQQHANEQARRWVNEMYPNETSHVSCQNADTDSNGYVSCTVRVGDHAPMSIECSVPYSLNEGCKIPVFQQMLQRQNQQN